MDATEVTINHVADDCLPPADGVPLLMKVLSALEDLQTGQETVLVQGEPTRLVVITEKVRDRMASWLRKAIREVR